MSISIASLIFCFGFSELNLHKYMIAEGNSLCRDVHNRYVFDRKNGRPPVKVVYHFYFTSFIRRRGKIRLQLFGTCNFQKRFRLFRRIAPQRRGHFLAPTHAMLYQILKSVILRQIQLDFR